MTISKPFAVVFGLDGCLADASHREQKAYVRKGNKYGIDMEIYFQDTITDPVKNHIRVMLLGLQKLHGTALTTIICTERPGTLAKDTKDWLSRQGIEHTLLMREPEDLRSDSGFKVEKILQLNENYNLLMVVDVDDEVAKACHKNNISFIRVY